MNDKAQSIGVVELKKELSPLEKFLNKLHDLIDPKNVKKHKVYKKYQYLPISFIEMRLDELFETLWSTRNFSYDRVCNEIIGSIELHYFHPVKETWLCRVGTGAVPIQMKAGDNPKANQIEEKKYLNALVKDFPHLKAQCLRNAAVSLGKSFGRDLNREFEDDFTPYALPTPEEEAKTIQKNVFNCIVEAEKEGTIDSKRLEEIRAECRDAVKSKTFTITFANKILKELTGV